MIDQDEMIVPLAPDRAPIWSRGFLALFVGGVLVGSGFVWFIINQAGADSSIEQILALLKTTSYFSLVAAGLTLIICLIGSSFTRRMLVRVGFCLQAGALAGDIIGTLFYLDAFNNPTSQTVAAYYQWSPHLQFIRAVLYAAGLVCLSYGLVRWKGSVDAWLFLAQIILSGVLVFILKDSIFTTAPYQGPLLERVVVVWCNFFGLALLALRPAFWRRFPLVTILLAAEPLLVTILYLALPLRDLIAHLSLGQEEGLFFGLGWLSILAFLLLAQTERVQKQVQPASLDFTPDIVNEPLP